VVLTLVDLKDKLKPQLKKLWDVDDFKIIKASHVANKWIVEVEYQKPNKSLAGDTVFYFPVASAIAANDETGQIESIS